MAAYTKPELIDGDPHGDTVGDGIMKTDINVDDIYAALNDLLSQIPDDLNPNAYYRVDGSNQLTANFQAGNFILRNVSDPIEDNDAATQGWSNSHFLPLAGGTVVGPILYATAPATEFELANKAYVDASGGGGGEGVWGSITGEITHQADLMLEFGKKADSGHLHLDASSTVSGFMSASDKDKFDRMADPALLEEFKDFSTGTPDAGSPIKLDGYGVLDVSFFSIKIFNLVGDWTPTSSQEYPTPAEPGDYWIIENVGTPGSGGYTFTTGYLDGRTVYDNELIVKGRDNKWGVIHLKVDPNLYYRLDGQNHLTNDFQAGGHKLSNISDGTSDSDAASVGQLEDKLDLTGGTLTGDLFIDKSSGHSLLQCQSRSGSDGRIEMLIDGARRGAIHVSESKISLYGFESDSGTVYGSIIFDQAGKWCQINSQGGLWHGAYQVYTDDYHPGSGGGDAVWGSITGNIGDQDDLAQHLNAKLGVNDTAADSNMLNGYLGSHYARVTGNNYFQERCSRDSTDSTYGYCMWETTYNNLNVWTGIAQGVNGWQAYISAFSGTPGNATLRPLYFIHDFIPETDNYSDLGSTSLKMDTIYAYNNFSEGDPAKVRNVAVISDINSNLILSLTPKAFEVIPVGISGSAFLADQPPATEVPTHLGFMADEVEAAMVAAGHNPDDFALTTGDPGNKCVNMTELIPLLVKKIQDLETRIAILEAP